jgi:acyl-CoA thioesterase
MSSQVFRLPRVEITLDDRWSIGGRPHGGYLLREVVRPLLSEAHPHPLVVSAHFLRSPDAGPATVEHEALRHGRRVSQHRTRLVQHGETILEALVSTGTLDPEAEARWSSSVPVELPPLEDCLRTAAEVAPGFRVGHLDFVDVRLQPDWPSFGQLTPTPGQSAARLRMADGPTSTLDLLVLADALQPTAMGLGVPGWFPTVELTVYVRAIPADGWLIGRQRTQELLDGWFDEDCEIWDSRGRLVCQARQLAGYRSS